jgi:F1F0 ATPase subunit 2
MHDAVVLVGASVAGLVLGALFFGSLWWTTREGMASPRPAMWFVVGLVARMSAALAGFYFVGRGHAARLLLCLVGFIAARVVVTWLTRPLREAHARPARMADHAH